MMNKLLLIGVYNHGNSGIILYLDFQNIRSLFCAYTFGGSSSQCQFSLSGLQAAVTWQQTFYSNSLITTTLMLQDPGAFDWGKNIDL